MLLGKEFPYRTFSSKQSDRTYFNNDFNVAFPNKLIELILTEILMLLSLKDLITRC
jgi:hypothetical protein